MRDRTADLLRAKQALSQLSYSPVAFSLLNLPWARWNEATFITNKRALFQRSIKANLVGLGGFEPPTSPLSGVRSNQLSYRPKFTLGLLHAQLADTTSPFLLPKIRECALIN